MMSVSTGRGGQLAAICAARRVSERCSLGAEARSALQTFACTARGEEGGQCRPIRSQYGGQQPMRVQAESTLPVASSVSARLSQH